MRLSGAKGRQRRPLWVAVFLLCLAVFAAGVPAYATTLPNDQPDPGQVAAFRKLYAVAINAYNRKMLPKSAVTAAKALSAGAKPGSASFNTQNRQAFWLLVASDLNLTTQSMVGKLQSGKSVRDLASAKVWKTVRTDARAWATHELDLELFKDPTTGKALIDPPHYYRIRAKVYKATDTILTVRVPKPRPVKPTPTPKPKPTPTKKPTPSPTPKPTKTPKVINFGR
jgi:hypothetical protein